MRTIVAVLVALLVGATVNAQDKDLIDELQKLDSRVFKPDSADAKQRFDSVRKLRDAVNKKDVEAWRNITSKAEWEKFRDERLAALKQSLGHWPEAPKDVKVITTKKLQGDGCTIECLIYESRPSFYVTANLYVPEKTDKAMPGFIVIHSHHNPKTQSELQDMGMIWARQGCLVLIPDMIGHGERRQHPFVDAKAFPEKFAVSRQDYWFRYNTNLQLSLIGDSLMGWMVWDLMRGVDVLYQRPNLDKSKVMVFGSVAGGGDPCAVFAALDKRITAAAPFNFGGPQPETPKLGQDAEFAFNYMGGGSWESTRGLKLSAKGGFLPWLIVGSLAPRGLIYSHEFAWDDKNDPVWARYNKIWGEFYDAKDKLASTKGAGAVTISSKLGSTHCDNIGAVHRKPMYPTLNKWFGLPIPEENSKRFTSAELRCWTDEAKKTLKPKMLHEIVASMADQSKGAGTIKDLLGVSSVPKKAASFGRIEAPLSGGHQVRWQRIASPFDSDLSLPVLLLIPKKSIKGKTPVVIALAQDGKAGFLKHRAEAIAKLLESGVAVCLPDLRGTGETANDGRGRGSGATSYSASLLMHGQTVPGVQLQELAMLNQVLAREFGAMAYWGDSFVEPNDPKSNFAIPLDGKLPRQAEPMGSTMALLGAQLGGDNVKAIYVRGGLVSFRSMLETEFCYFPHDAVIPGVLLAGDLPSLVEANSKRSLRMESLVNGENTRVDQRTLDETYGKRAEYRGEPSSQAYVAAWLNERLRK